MKESRQEFQSETSKKSSPSFRKSLKVQSILASHSTKFVKACKIEGIEVTHVLNSGRFAIFGFGKNIDQLELLWTIKGVYEGLYDNVSDHDVIR